MPFKISKIPAPALAGVIREKSAGSAIAEIKNCMYDGADMIDLHLSCLEDVRSDSLKAIISASKLPVLALNYNRNYEWGDCGLSEAERTESLLEAVRGGAAGIDMQGYTFDAESRDGFHGENKYSFTKDAPKETNY